MRTARRLVLALAMALSLLVPGVVEAQNTGAITGVARDTSGAVLPGVTVEVASPALIERVRVVTTDEQGRFNVVDLPPAVYSVTFALQGFSTFKRANIDLSAGFTATANGDMAVGAVAETVTVTGASPVVDVQNVRTQQVLRREVLAALPSGARDLQALAGLTLGAAVSSASGNDVGGATADAAFSMVLHGGRDSDAKSNWDGMNINSFNGMAGGNMRSYKYNMLAAQETVINTSSASAETETSGANINVIPREGGNAFSLQSVVSYTNQTLASGKVSDALVARGSAPDQNSVKKVYDYGVAMGGAIVRDHLWVYNANRTWGSHAYGANNYFNKSTNWYRYEPDLSRPAYTDTWQRDVGARFTVQASTKHKINTSLHWQMACRCGAGLSTGTNASPETVSDFRYGYGPGIKNGMWLSQTRWTYPATNRLLFQATAMFLKQPKLSDNFHTPGPNDVNITEQTTGYAWGSFAGGGYDKDQSNNNFSQDASMSYVSGVHVFKAGVQTLEGQNKNNQMYLPNGTTYVFRNGVPLSLAQFASPFANEVGLRSLGLFAQEQWTINRLTLNLGLRYDHFRAYAQPMHLPAGPFIGERSYPGVQDVPNYQDLTPRLGAAYDIFGNGRTAIKVAWGRYLRGLGSAAANVFSQGNTIISSTTRQWTDSNGNFIPDCVLTNLQQNGECGTVANLAFGQPAVVTKWDARSRAGWGVRETNYQTSVTLQHELRPGLGASISYNRTDWRNQIAVVNNALGVADFTPYCVTAPQDARLGAFSGRPICGLFDQVPAKFGQVDDVLMRVRDVPGAKGRPAEVFNGVDVAMNARFGTGGVLQGGITFGRTMFDTCWLNDLPNVTNAIFTGGAGTLTRLTAPRTADYCKVQSPLWNGGGSQIKLQAVYPLPHAFVASGTFKHLPGNLITANYTASNAQVRASLGRDLSACRGAAVCTQNVSVPLLPSVTNAGSVAAVMFDERITQLDLRLTRGFRFGRRNIKAIADLYNVFNDRPPLSSNGTYGAVWQRPTAILGGRLFAIGAQFDY